jgi:hypothetical protein
MIRFWKNILKLIDKKTVLFAILDALKADGFNTAHFIGIEVKDGKNHYCSYNYGYHIYIKDNIKMIKIYKR